MDPQKLANIPKFSLPWKGSPKGRRPPLRGFFLPFIGFPTLGGKLGQRKV